MFNSESCVSYSWSSVEVLIKSLEKPVWVQGPKPKVAGTPVNEKVARDGHVDRAYVSSW